VAAILGQLRDALAQAVLEDQAVSYDFLVAPALTAWSTAARLSSRPSVPWARRGMPQLRLGGASRVRRVTQPLAGTLKPRRPPSPPR